MTIEEKAAALAAMIEGWGDGVEFRARCANDGDGHFDFMGLKIYEEGRKQLVSFLHEHTTPAAKAARFDVTSEFIDALKGFCTSHGYEIAGTCSGESIYGEITVIRVQQTINDDYGLGFVIYGENGLPLVAMNFETREAAVAARQKMAEILMTCVAFGKIP